MGLIDLGWSPMDTLKSIASPPVPKIDLGFSPVDKAANVATFGMSGKVDDLANKNKELQESLGKLTEQPKPEAEVTGGAAGSTPLTKEAVALNPEHAENMKAAVFKGAGVEHEGSGLDKHLVEQGQTLSSIAETSGKSVDELMAMNPDITDANQINVGQELNMGELVGSGSQSEGIAKAAEAVAPAGPAAPGPELQA